MRPYQYPEPINELGGQTAVSSLTVLKAFTELGNKYHTLLFVLRNLDSTNSADFIIETSESGVVADGLIKWTLPTAALKESSLEIGPGQIRRYWRISAQTAGPTVNVTWAVKGVHRA